MKFIANLNATAILSQRETWVRAVSVVAWPQYTHDFLKDHKGLTEIRDSLITIHVYLSFVISPHKILVLDA